MRTLVLLAAALGLISCGGSSTPAPEAPKKEAAKPKPADETRRFPMANQASTKVVDDHILDMPFMPGGTVAHYKKGKQEFDMFLAKMSSPTDAAIALSDWRKALTDSKLVPSFGGYFGMNKEQPVFVFSKGAWIAGIAGLQQKDADIEARTLATKIE